MPGGHLHRQDPHHGTNELCSPFKQAGLDDRVAKCCTSLKKGASGTATQQCTLPKGWVLLVKQIKASTRNFHAPSGDLVSKVAPPCLDARCKSTDGRNRSLSISVRVQTLTRPYSTLPCRLATIIDHVSAVSMMPTYAMSNADVIPSSGPKAARA